MTSSLASDSDKFKIIITLEIWDPTKISFL